MINICILEDIPEIQLGLKSIIELNNNFSILKCFNNAEDAMAEIPTLIPQIVIADINLPGQSGIDCVRFIKNILPSIQFIMFTIYEDNDQVFEAIKAGANGYILKNTPPAKIIDSLLDLSEGGSPMTPKIARKVLSNMQSSQINNEINTLTSRENEVLQLLSKGFLYKEIADKLEISISTVKRHLSHIYQKLQVQNKTEAINKMYSR